MREDFKTVHIPPDAPASSKRVLLVQDDADEENVALRALARCAVPMVVTVAHDGREALEAMYGSGGVAPSINYRLDLIMLDLGLPKMDGLEVLQRIRSESKTAYVPVVITSGSQDPTRLRLALESGANSVLMETIDYETHVEALALAGRYWLLAHRAQLL